MSKKAFDASLEGKLVKKISELYITNRKKYLKLNKEGEYATIVAPLHDGLIASHLKGNHTIGVFSGSEVSKFICFDIDMVDKSKLNWVYYLLRESLSDLGLSDEYIHVASSGNKGLHVLLFVENGSSLSHFKLLFKETMKIIQDKVDNSIKTKLFNGNELALELTDICNIEFRPNGINQGVKLELGINFKNKDNKTNKCIFVGKETLIDTKIENYILSIDPMPKDEFLELIDKLNDTYEEQIKENIDLIKSNITEPYSHKINKDENETIQYIVDLIQNGLHMTGTRHNSVLKIAKYFRYMGLELDQCIDELIKWMKNQDTKYYSSTLEYALSECVRVSEIVYEKEYSLVGHIDNLKIYKSEMKEIIGIKEKNTKIIFFAMLLHSKRFSLKNGVFYMTYKQIEEMTGLGRKAATNNIEELEKRGFVEVVDRNIKQEGTHIKKPNKYRIILTIDQIEDGTVLEVDNASNILDYSEIYFKSLAKLFTNKELSHLPKRQRVEINTYRQLVS